MPKAEIPTGYAQAIANGTYGPTSWVNIMYFLVTPVGTPTLLEVAQDVGWAMEELYNKLGYAHFSANWTHSITKVLYRDSDTDFTRVVRVADAVGTDSSGDQDAQVSYLLNWAAGDVRRGGKPRTYVTGVPMDACADSAKLTSTFLGAMNSGLVDWFTELAAGGAPSGTELNPVEMSFINAKADRTVPQPYLITSGNVNQVVATQRRRIDRLRS